MAAETAVGALLDWSASFLFPSTLISDVPTHCRNEILCTLIKKQRTVHPFTLPYAPWSNGGIERLGKGLIRMARSLLSELHMRYDE